MTEKQKKLIMNLATNAITKDQFFKEYRVDVKNDGDYVLNWLGKIYETKNKDELEYAFLLGFHLDSFSFKYTDLLCKLIVEKWHHQHEDIAMILQKLKAPDTVDCLYKAALTYFDYLAYNDCEALISKCTWALGDINTPYAREKLQQLAQSENKIIADAALFQLRRHS